MSQEQNQTESELKMIFFKRWSLWLEELKRQRMQAFKVYQFQNDRELSTLKRYFQEWKKLKEKPPSTFSRKDESLIRSDQEDKVRQPFQIYERKCKARCIRGILEYSIQTKKFKIKLTQLYIRYIFKKYFAILLQYKNSRQSKRFSKNRSKADTSQQQTFSIEEKGVQKVQYQTATLSFMHSGKKVVEIPQNKTLANFLPELPNQLERDSLLKNSRNSLYSGVTDRTEALHMRKYKPVLNVPSLPDLQEIQRVGSYNQRLFSDEISENSLNQPQSQTQNKKETQQELRGKQNASGRKSNGGGKADSILGLLTKVKLAQLNILSDSELFAEQQYRNYAEKTKVKLDRISKLSTAS